MKVKCDVAVDRKVRKVSTTQGFRSDSEMLT